MPVDQFSSTNGNKLLNRATKWWLFSNERKLFLVLTCEFLIVSRFSSDITEKVKAMRETDKVEYSQVKEVRLTFYCQ